MIGNLAAAIDSLLTTAMPTLIGIADGQVTLQISRPTYEVDPSSADALAGTARPDDRRDTLPFDPNNPVGPHLLSQPPYPGPRRVYLENVAGERLTLGADEVIWDLANPQQFSLQLKAHRDVSGLNQITVLYSISAIFTTVKALNSVSLTLTATNSANLLAAETLAVSIMQMNRESLRENAAATVNEGDYSAQTSINKLIIDRGNTIDTNNVVIVISAESEVKVSRALQPDEGAVIERIAAPGTTPDPNRPVDIDPWVEA